MLFLSMFQGDQEVVDAFLQLLDYILQKEYVPYQQLMGETPLSHDACKMGLTLWLGGRDKDMSRPVLCGTLHAGMSPVVN